MSVPNTMRVSLLNQHRFFTGKMLDRLLEKEVEGFTGWNDRASLSDTELLTRVLRFICLNEYVNAANLIMFLEYRQRNR